LDHAFHDAHHPAGAFTARRALATALMLEESRDAPDRPDDIGVLVHDDHAAGPEGRLLFAHAIKVHGGIHHVFATHHRAGRAAGNDRKQIVPAAADTAAMLFDDVLEALAQGL